MAWTAAVAKFAQEFEHVASNTYKNREKNSHAEGRGNFLAPPLYPYRWASGEDCSQVQPCPLGCSPQRAEGHYCALPPTPWQTQGQNRQTVCIAMRLPSRWPQSEGFQSILHKQAALIPCTRSARPVSTMFSAIPSTHDTIIPDVIFHRN